jgi:hypothetical protein
MKTSSTIKLFVIFALLTTIIYPQNVSDALRIGIPGLGSSARALGMGNSYIGLSDDASAAYFNPAGFGLLERLEFSGGFDFSKYNNNATLTNNGNSLGGVTSDNSNSTRLDRLSFAFPYPTAQGSLVFGLSYQNTKDFNSTLSFNGYNPSSSFISYLAANQADITAKLHLSSPVYNTDGTYANKEFTLLNGLVNQSGNILNSGGINSWTLSGAVELYKNLFVGLNIDLLSGSYDSNNDYYEDATDNTYKGVTDTTNPSTTNFQTFYLNRILKWDISGWDAKLGFLYQFNKMARLGITVQFPKTFTIKESFSVSGYSQFANQSFYLNPSDFSYDNVQYDVITPYELGAGFSFNIRGLILSAQGTLIDYSQLKFDNYSDGTNSDQSQYLASVNKDIKNNLTAVFNYNIGAEYTLRDLGLRFRGGFFVQPSPYKGDPASFDKKYFTLGAGILTDETIGLDIAYAHGWYMYRGDNYGVNVSATSQKITENHFILSGTYRF